jgi:hypothetical protein
MAQLLEQGHSLSSAAKTLAGEYLIKRKFAYALALKARQSANGSSESEESAVEVAAISTIEREEGG